MAQEYTRWERFYNRLNLWFNGTVAFSIIPFGLIFLDTQSEFPEPPLISGLLVRFLQGVIVTVCGGLIWFGLHYAKKQLASLTEDTIDDRLVSYLAIRVRAFLILELGAVLAVIGFYLTKDQLFTGVYLVIMFVFSLSRPTFEKVANDIRVSQKALAEWGRNK